MKRGLCCFLIPLITITLSAPSYAGWGKNGNFICKAVGKQDQPDLDASGNALITWRDFRNGNGDIYAQEMTADGKPQWPAGNPNPDQGIKICDDASNQHSPRAIRFGPSEINRFHRFSLNWIVWVDERDGGPRIYFEMVDDAGAPKFGNGKRVCKTESDQSEFDVAGIWDFFFRELVVVWKDSRNNATAGKDIYAQRVTQDGNLAWGDDGKLVSGAGGDQANPKTVVVLNHIFVAWEDQRSGVTDTDVFAQKLDMAGARKWAPADGALVCNAAGHQRSIALTRQSDPIIAWEDARNEAVDSLDIYAQRLKEADGSPRWAPDDGVVICNAPMRQRSPRVMDLFSPDTDIRGAYIAWRDQRDGGTIRAQRVDDGGVGKWAANGVSVAVNLFDDPRRTFTILAIKQDLLNTWSLASPGREKIVAYRFKVGDGSWRDNRTLCETAENPNKWAVYQPRADGYEEGIFVVWTDERRGADNSDIVANWTRFEKPEPKKPEQKAPEPGPSISQLTLLQNHPNPFRGSTEFRVGLPEAGSVTLEVFDVSGRRVWEQQIAELAAGWHSIPFDGNEQGGRNLPSGVYFCRVSALGVSQRLKLVIQR
jgi:hypothetical protein